MPQPRILLLTASIGVGHVRAAQAVAGAINRLRPDAAIRMADIMGDRAGLWKQWVKKGYYSMIRHLPSLYERLYQWSDGQASTVLLAEYAIRSDIRKLLSEFRPDVILSTHPFAAVAAGHVLLRKKDPLPLGCLLTDYGAHRMWTHPRINRYFTATEEVKKRLSVYGVPLDTIDVTGLPVDESFLRPERVKKESAALRRDLSLDSLPVVLLMGGGGGLGPMEEYLSTLSRCDLPLQIIVLTGNNPDLHDAASRLAADSRKRIIVRGFTRQVAAYLQLADILITKPGGMTLTEAAISGTAVILLDPLPGQETDNALFFSRSGGAVRCRRTEDLLPAIQSFLENPSFLRQTQSILLALARPGATDVLAENVLRAASRSLVLPRRPSQSKGGLS